MKKILGFVIQKEDDYDKEKNKIKDLISDNNLLCSRIEDLESYHLKKDSEALEYRSALENNCLDLKNKVKILELQINSLKKSNGGYKSNNSRLKREKEELERELANSYKRTEIPADRAKSKLVPKVKSSRRLSEIVKTMNS